jgi:Stress responsive A/B Barrel Domain.
MVRHIVMWSFKEGLGEAERLSGAQKIKEDLEALASQFDGAASLKVIISPLKSANRDIMLDSLFVSNEALAEYQVLPEHVRIGKFIGTILENRACMDFLE